MNISLNRRLRSKILNQTILRASVQRVEQLEPFEIQMLVNAVVVRRVAVVATAQERWND